jgi:integrase
MLATPKPTPAPKLLTLVRRAVRVHHYSPRTEEAYVAWVRRFVRYHGFRHPSELGPDEVRDFLTVLADRGKLSASSQTQALSALLFLYREVLGRDLSEVGAIIRAKQPTRLPVVLSHDEVRALLGRLQGSSRLVCALLYGSGLRLLEALGLRVKDLDLSRGEILVRRAKGAKDRVTMLPTALRADLEAHLEKVRRLHRRDLGQGGGKHRSPMHSSGRPPRRHGTGPGSTSSRPTDGIRTPPATCAGTTCTSRSSSEPCAVPWPRRGSPSEQPATACGIPSRLTCCRTGRTSARCRSCSATTTSRRR